MDSFNVVVHNDRVKNVSATISHVVDCITNNRDVSLFIDESPDLACVLVEKEYFVSLLQGLCEKFGYSPSRISIEIENLVQSDCWPNIKRCYKSVDVFYGQQLKFKVDKRNIKFKTSIFAHGSRWPRLSLASYIYGNYKDDSIISYWQNLKDRTQPCSLYLDDLFMNHMLKGVDTAFIDQIKNFLNALPLHVQDADRERNKNIGSINYPEAYDLAPIYNEIFCDVVCETVHNGQTFAFTEKSARCWLTKTPFLVFGPKHYLSNIRRLGFQTFGAFWNESYDRYDNATRILMMQKQIDCIHQMDQKTLTEMYWSDEMQKILENNNQVFKGLSSDRIKEVFGIV